MKKNADIHQHKFEKKVRFTEQVTNAHDGWERRSPRKFIGYQCDCKKVNVIDIV